MDDIIDIFYKDVINIIEGYQQSIIDKNFVDKAGYIEEIPINTAKGELNATKQLQVRIKNLYKKYKEDLNTIE